MIIEETSNETINKNPDDGNNRNNGDSTSSPSSSDSQLQDAKLITVDASPEAIREAKAALNDIFEQIFTKQHVETDEYLQSHMTPSLTLPIHAVLDIPRIRAVAADAAIVREVLQESKMVTVNGDLIKLNIKLEQNTVILRDIAKETNENDIRNIFEGSKGCPEIVNIRSDVGDTWFVTFATEDDAKTALQAITGKTFNDKPVKGRLKQESLKKSFFTSPTFSNVGGPPNGAGNAGGMYAGPAPMGVPPIPLPFPPPFFAPMQNGFIPGPGGYPMDVGGPKLFMPPIMHGMAQGPGQQGQMLPNMGNMRRNNNKGRGRGGQGQNQGQGNSHQQGQVAWFPVPNMGMMPMMGGGGRYNPRPYMGNQQQMGGQGHQRRSDGNNHDYPNHKNRGKSSKVDNGQMSRQSPKVKNNNNNNNHNDGHTGLADNNVPVEGEKKKKAPKQKKKGNSNEEVGTATTPGSTAVVSGDLENSVVVASGGTVSNSTVLSGDSSNSKDKDNKEDTKKGSPRSSSGDAPGNGGNRDQQKQKNKNNNSNNNNQNQNQKKASPPPNFNLDSDFPSLEGEEGLVVQTPSPKGSSPSSAKQISAGAWAAAARTGNIGNGSGTKEKIDTSASTGEVESGGTITAVVASGKNNSDSSSNKSSKSSNNNDKKVNVGSIEVAFGDINVSKGREAISSSVVVDNSQKAVVIEPFSAQDLNSNATPVSFGRFDSVNVSSQILDGDSSGRIETNISKADNEKSSSAANTESGNKSKSSDSSGSSNSNTGTGPAMAAVGTTKAGKNKAKTKAATTTTTAATISSVATGTGAPTNAPVTSGIGLGAESATTVSPSIAPTTSSAGGNWGGKKSFSDVLKSNKVFNI